MMTTMAVAFFKAGVIDEGKMKKVSDSVSQVKSLEGKLDRLKRELETGKLSEEQELEVRTKIAKIEKTIRSFE